MNNWLEIKCVLFFVGLVLQPYCHDGAMAQVEFTGNTMGPIEYRVVIQDLVDDKEKLGKEIQNVLDRVNVLMSTYIETSDVSRVNQSTALRWVEVDPETFGVVKKALEISEKTSGTFDITVGPAVRLWKFGPDKELQQTPTDSELDEIKKYVGYQKIELQVEPPAIRKLHDQTQIDLSAIAKGYAVDQVSARLLQRSLQNFMVEVGGEVYVHGRSKNGKWRIGIEQPTGTERRVSAVARISDSALATSGDYRNFKVIDGKRISHTIDPTTCRPVENMTASCSVVASDCMTADALATALMVMGSEAGLEFCRQQGISASIIKRDVNAQLTTVSTDHFPVERLTQQKTDEPTSIVPAFVGALVVFGLAIAGMAIGAIFNNKPITGSCGGIAATPNEDGASSCSMCQKPVNECPENAKKIEQCGGISELESDGYCLF